MNRSAFLATLDETANTARLPCTMGSPIRKSGSGSPVELLCGLLSDDFWASASWPISKPNSEKANVLKIRFIALLLAERKEPARGRRHGDGTPLFLIVANGQTASNFSEG